jgi:hypothetical protein
VCTITSVINICPGQDVDITAEVDKTGLLLGVVSPGIPDLISTGTDGVEIISMEGGGDCKLGLSSPNVTITPSCFVDLSSPATNLKVNKTNMNTPRPSRDIITII